MRRTACVQVCLTIGEWNHRAAAVGRNTAVWTNHDCAVVGQSAADRSISANCSIICHFVADRGVGLIGYRAAVI